jgi:hypothetical protein
MVCHCHDIIIRLIDRPDGVTRACELKLTVVVLTDWGGEGWILVIVGL